MSSTASRGPENKLRSIFSWVVTLGWLVTSGRTSQRMECGRFWRTVWFLLTNCWWKLMLHSCIPTPEPASSLNISKIVSQRDQSPFYRDTAPSRYLMISSFTHLQTLLFREMSHALSQSLLRWSQLIWTKLQKKWLWQQHSMLWKFLVSQDRSDELMWFTSHQIMNSNLAIRWARRRKLFFYWNNITWSSFGTYFTVICRAASAQLCENVNIYHHLCKTFKRFWSRVTIITVNSHLTV